MNIQWFPGHMAKTRRLLKENLKLVDVVVELLDARIPVSSKNPEIDNIIGNKPRVLVLNKMDLADENVTKEWANWYEARGIIAIPVDSLRGKGLNNLINSLKYIMKEKFERDRQKGRIFRPVRTMIVGIPNVGKSAFINKIAGKAVAMTGDRPGITRGKQWIRLNPSIDMLDTPGILSPKFDDPETALNLAFTGAIKDDIIDVERVAASLAERLSSAYAEMFKNRYKLSRIEGLNGLELLEAAGRNRGCIISGGNIDLRRIAVILLDEFRGGKIGRISLEKPGWGGEEKPDRE
ncbi:MAG: ribosome biogenesis GTPase YlqF [Acetivibrionales bacterium]|jgi:ribosome biogenesis GTPase A